MKFNLQNIFLISALLFLFTSCFGDDDGGGKDYSEWRELNDKYIISAEEEMINGKLRYQKVIPPWDKTVYALVEWHKVSEGKNKIQPLSNSTIKVAYVLKNINGDTLDSSPSYLCQPRNMISGFWTTVTNMVPGDSVTSVIPYTAGYGAVGNVAVLPYSTLVFNIRLDSIVAYEKLP